MRSLTSPAAAYRAAGVKFGPAYLNTARIYRACTVWRQVRPPTLDCGPRQVTMVSSLPYARGKCHSFRDRVIGKSAECSAGLLTGCSEDVLVRACSWLIIHSNGLRTSGHSIRSAPYRLEARGAFLMIEHKSCVVVPVFEASCGSGMAQVSVPCSMPG
jgi:hypothetical protein